MTTPLTERVSTVGVRQRALHERRKSALSLVQLDLLLVQRAVGMEPLKELSRSEQHRRGVR